MRLISFACLLAVGLSAPAFAMRGPMSGPYAHALRIAAQRDAFWHAHRLGHRRGETEETSLRKAGYWQAQLRGRALGSAFASE